MFRCIHKFNPLIYTIANSRRGSISTPSVLHKEAFDSNTRLSTQRGSISNTSNSLQFELSADAKAKMERGKDL
eukprot:1387607-Amorphochlora_amoeboformis.AAC.1